MFGLFKKKNVETAQPKEKFRAAKTEIYTNGEMTSTSYSVEYWHPSFRLWVYETSAKSEENAKETAHRLNYPDTVEYIKTPL